MREHLAIVELGTVEYQRAHALQQALVAARLDDRIGDTLLVLEHPHVYTLGRGADEKFILAPHPGVPVIRVSRGGQVTYHGPGQIVAYPILKLEGPARDVGRYLRQLEQVLIEALAQHGVCAARRERLTGVWIGARKIASIGVGIRRWVTYHGLALNLTTDLSYFDSIIPCGIEGCQMTSLARLGLKDLGVAEFTNSLCENFRRIFDYPKLTYPGGDGIWSWADLQPTSAEPPAGEARG
ncbi:MAG: lipoyl(octanoyl) transferase LipB [Deltaproteobacteria bacterium]|nr:lipoyl(octanoyl) transferase LipB [Deltaproteobacteria bacterium]